MRLAPAALTEVASAVLSAAGLPPADAALIARHLVESNLAGHDSHGVIRVVQYAHDIAAGRIAAAEPEVVSDAPALVVLDGHWAAGQVVAQRAVDLALARVPETGAVVVAARRSGHTGRLGAYVEALARAGYIGLAMVNNHGGGLVMSPPGGTERRLSPNPIAFAAPGRSADGDGPQEPGLLLDMTTSVVAEGKLRIARNRGDRVPGEWVRDAAGHPATDPAAFYGDGEDEATFGSIPPFGGDAAYKGFGLALMVEVLAGLLPGAAASGEEGRPGANALWLLAIDPRAAGREDLPDRLDALGAWVRSAQTAPGVGAITLPGDPERRARAARRDAVEVDGETWRQVVECGETFGVAPAVFEAAAASDVSEPGG